MASAPAPTTATKGNKEYVSSQSIQDKTGKQIKLQSTWTTDYHCMIIGSYGDQYESQVKDRVVPKEPSKLGGKFLRGVSADLEIVQEMIMNDPRKHLAWVLPDVPGAQDPRSHYINKIEGFLKDCQKSGALIWYTGHGEKGTGNWCFKDGVISMQDIIRLYQQHFSGRLLTIVCDCCYSGQWVYQLADMLDNHRIDACGHQTNKAGLAMKVFTACQRNEVAFDTVFAKQCVFVEPTSGLMTFVFNAVETCGRFQTPTALDTTKITCFSDKDEKQCKLEHIPQKPLWLWKDLMTGDDRNKRLQLRMLKIWEKKNQQPYWNFVIVRDDKFEEFCQVAQSNQPYDQDLYGYTIFSGYGLSPPPEKERLFCKCGPVSVNLPENEFLTPGSQVDLKTRSS